MRVAAILTGKKNSSLKNKNLLKINGKPIFSYSAKVAKQIKKIDRFFVSSDSNYILNYCYKLGYEKIKRPTSLCRQNSLHINVIRHALNFMQKRKFFPDVIIILLANAPIIKKNWLNDCLNILKKEKKTSSVVPVIKNNDFNPLRAKKIKKNYLVNYIKSKNKVSSNRQSLEGSYFLCHNFWAIKTKFFFKNNGEPPWNFMGKKVKPYIIDNSIDIHTKQDLELAKMLIQKLKIKL